MVRPALLHLLGPQVCPDGPPAPLEVHPAVIVEVPVLVGDDRPREMLPEVVEADGLEALFHLELANPVSARVVYARVLGQLRVPLVETIPILSDNEHVDTHQDDGGDSHDQDRVEDGSERPEEKAESALFGRFLARFEEAVHGSPAH
jgi:hypothetical protein